MPKSRIPGIRYNSVMHDYQVFAESIARKAGEIIRMHYGEAFVEKEKSEAVTEIDKRVNRLLIQEVEKKYPSHSVYGEEETMLKNSPFSWVCDPIDGTLHFTTRTPLALCSRVPKTCRVTFSGERRIPYVIYCKICSVMSGAMVSLNE
jgi:hypothetical protein